MNYNPPLPISDAEWNELAAHPAVRDNWYLDPNDTGDDLSAQVYGAKFEHRFDANPHLVTDLYVLTAWITLGKDGDARNAVVILCRNQEDGELEPLSLPFPF